MTSVGRLCLFYWIDQSSPYNLPPGLARKELFRERIGAPGQYIASPIAAGDKLVAAYVRGVVTVIEVDDKPNVPA